ncbi:uncharacterized protein N7483_000202 [Penicillium malachiteum]|uniref:uncharacterized protein n=1 Tax=Penicillium malachiteum TaxID=1324776 RepID=UPI0025489637|nr:uncharacterized protein N7483_000202 [Penicillium malachiteum]KAJ5735077.1 hypothetical protein N7483_000202 [Penicillium malachiteum]
MVELDSLHTPTVMQVWPKTGSSELEPQLIRASSIHLSIWDLMIDELEEDEKRANHENTAHSEKPTTLSSLDVVKSLHLPFTTPIEDRELYESTKYLLFTQLGIVYDADALEPIIFT